MADPRDTVDFEGIGAEYATYKIDGSTIVYDATKAGGADTTMLNKAVTLTAARTVGLATDASRVVGKLISVESDNKCTVQVDGYMTLPGGASASLTLGKSVVGALGAASAKGYIREVATGAAAELGVAEGMIVDAADATAVVIDL